MRCGFKNIEFLGMKIFTVSETEPTDSTVIEPRPRSELNVVVTIRRHVYGQLPRTVVYSSTY